MTFQANRLPFLSPPLPLLVDDAAALRKFRWSPHLEFEVASFRKFFSPQQLAPGANETCLAAISGPIRSYGSSSMNGRILVVEDCTSFQEFLSMLLRRGGYAVEVAHDVEGAFQLLEAGNTALVLTDLQLPGCSGLELLERIKQQPAMQHIPVVVLTAWDAPEAKHSAVNLGCAAFLIKPVTNIMLLDTVRRLLGEAGE